MPSETSTLNASQAVERIREIIVGRHLERLEQRISRLEASDSDVASYIGNDERLMNAEARIEALHSAISRLTDHIRDELERRNVLQREEIHQLLLRVQQVTASTAPAISPDSSRYEFQKASESRTSAWKYSLPHSSEKNRQEPPSVSHLHSEFSQLKSTLEERLSRFEIHSSQNDSFEIGLQKIADAARIFTQSISHLPSRPSPADDSPTS